MGKVLFFSGDNEKEIFAQVICCCYLNDLLGCCCFVNQLFTIYGMRDIAYARNEWWGFTLGLCDFFQASEGK